MPPLRTRLSQDDVTLHIRMHYRLTTTCMLAFSIVVSASQYVGNPIDCIHTNDIPEVSPMSLTSSSQVTCPGCGQHLLLDTLHLHNPQRFLEEDWL